MFQQWSHCQSLFNQETGYTDDRKTEEAKGMMRQHSVEQEQEAAHTPTPGLMMGKKRSLEPKLKPSCGRYGPGGTTARFQGSLGP